MLELKGICYSAEDESRETEILKDIDVTIDDRFVAVTGPNGSGKSTLARIVAGILKPTAGRILLDGVDITDLSITERANMGISFAFQQPVRFKGITVRELLSIAAGRKATMSEICGMLSEVGLCARDYVNREVNASLSGGELKRIEIAMIMARGTRLSIFDEPEAGIDLWSFNNLIRVFENMRDKIHGSILIISHQERILNIADQIIVLADGEVRAQGTRDEVLPELLHASSEACSALLNKIVYWHRKRRCGTLKTASEGEKPGTVSEGSAFGNGSRSGALREKMRNFKNSIERSKARNRFRRQCIRKRFQIRGIEREDAEL